MKFTLKNLWKAPISTLIGVVLISVFTGLLLGKFVEAESYVVLMTTTLPFTFSDPFGERKKSVADETKQD